MSEYLFIEKPLLTQLESINWQIIEQGPAIPKDPTLSLRTTFREVLLKGEFLNAVKSINCTPDGRAWLTDKLSPGTHSQMKRLR